jgi:hypothetical protein
MSTRERDREDSSSESSPPTPSLPKQYITFTTVPVLTTGLTQEFEFAHLVPTPGPSQVPVPGPSQEPPVRAKKSFPIAKFHLE